MFIMFIGYCPTAIGTAQGMMPPFIAWWLVYCSNENMIFPDTGWHLSGIKPLPKPMLTKLYIAICCHPWGCHPYWAKLSPPQPHPGNVTNSWLLHSPSLVAVGLSVGHETWPPISWHHLLVIYCSKYRLGLPQSQWIVSSRDWWKFLPTFKDY